ncbi:GAF domain-containing protein [Pedobacter sp. AW31-3R]|uniref:GAF domain-containing protein n=1 Tax=Pedobacter sp. AW31-3R TaxID=3445781 RepID=UPI003F9F749B
MIKNICGNEVQVLDAHIQFSLKPFIAIIKERIKKEKTAKVNFYKYLLHQFEVYPELAHPIKEKDIVNYHHLFELIHTALSPILTDEREEFWAIAKPISPCFYYGTDAFYEILMDAQNEKLKEGVSLPPRAEMEESIYKNFYNLVMKKFYDFSISGSDYMVKSILNRETNLLTYYRLNVDTRFLDITSKVALPELTLETAKEYFKDEDQTTEVLKTLFPPENFEVEGISIVTFTDVTEEYALEAIKNTIIDHNQCQSQWDIKAITSALKSLIGTDLVDFGLLPYIRLNGESMIYNHEGFESIIIQQAKANHMQEAEYQKLIAPFVANPRRMIFPQINMEEYSTYPMLKLLLDKGIRSYALFPLFYNSRLVGCLEMYTKDMTVFNGNTLGRIETAFPLLAQLYNNIITDFNNEIMAVVTDKFTALQPSVAWRFYQSAYNYMKSGAAKKNLPIEPVYFKDVFPFYGAVDIRNSSIERNLMIRKDLFAHFDVLETMLINLKSRIPIDVESDFPSGKSGWKPKKFDAMSDREIMKTDDYLQRQLPPYLQLLKAIHPEVEELLDHYFELTRPGGKIYENRDNYELSMKMINQAVARHLDTFNEEIQEIHPCYFEKFRTDGVEFDIYLGKSISPDEEFNEDIVMDFRFRQLKVIAEIARTTLSLKKHLPLPLETTQLLFVYEKLIDISFRIDEQRFDVEGSYNIRYQMVKKRIDKAHVKDSVERLTQPGKIAIVYFNSTEAQEYLKYIRRLQAGHLLTDSIEYLEIEELQGVEGLKALRVEVAMTESN